jgi:hypothetical protein
VSDDTVRAIQFLDPVVVEALDNITSSVCRRKEQAGLRRLKYVGMLDRHSRSCAIAAFKHLKHLKHLKHAGREFPPYLVRRWAVANGWKEDDAQLLDDYAAGVQAGSLNFECSGIAFDGTHLWMTNNTGQPVTEYPVN